MTEDEATPTKAEELKDLLSKYGLSDEDISKVKQLTRGTSKKTIDSALNVIRYNLVLQGLVEPDDPEIGGNGYVDHCIDAYNKQQEKNGTGRTWDDKHAKNRIPAKDIPKEISKAVKTFLKAIA